ncbi:uncharacterized protein LOC125213282 [Salvia hispanica]|uniref:uncharacterized protein LOC125213282 n=1 Tax=Salvia hispanica TaxID=49212 RepID=UPI0020092BBB|nr:uncharacterized protein LOC125213282 [Salvia hispanica]
MEIAKLPLSSLLVRGKQIQHSNTPLRNLNFNFKSKSNALQSPNLTATNNSQVSRKTISDLEIEVPTMAEIVESSRLQKLHLQLRRFGPFFRITAKSLKSGRELGRAEGVIRFWFGGKILHMDSIKLERETIGMNKSIFGIGLFLGAMAIRFGYECGCAKAELLAINDTPLYHSKLVRFYTRLGFKQVYEVEGGSLRDLSDMLVWGGVGTRMDANLQDLMIKWCSRFKPK